MPNLPALDDLVPSVVVPTDPPVSRSRNRHAIGRLIIQLENTGPGNTPQEGDDYVQPLKDRIGRYVATQTKDNRYPLPAQGDTASTFLTEVEEAGGSEALAIYKTTGRTEMFSMEDQGLDPEVRRVLRRAENLQGGTGALLEVEEKGVLAGIPRQVVRVLDENQADSPLRPHNAFEGGTENRSRNTGTIYSQLDLGRNRHNKRFINHGEPSPPPAEIGIRELKRLGILMMLKGSGELITPSNLRESETTWNNQIIASTILPSMTRLGQSVDVGRFATAELLQEVNPDFGRRATLTDTLEGEPQVASYGSPWNPFVQFTGLGGASAAVSCALLATTVSGLLKGLAELVVFAKGGYAETNTEVLDVSIPGLNSLSTTAPNRRARLGSYLEKPQEGFLSKLTGLVDIDTVKTEAPYFKALSKGIDVFFRLDQDTESGGFLGALESIGMTAGTFIEEYGWFSVVLRNLFASTTDVFLDGVTAVAQVVDPGTKFTDSSGLRVERGTLSTQSDFNRVTGILNIVNSLNDSYLLKFMNVLATIGDIALVKEFSGGQEDPDDVFDDTQPLEDSDLVKWFPKVGVLHQKGRISHKVPGFGGEIAWAGRNLPSLLLMPQSVLDGARTWGDGGRVLTLAAGTYSKVKDGNRLSGEDVSKIEEYLEASYMPFWFHDLRTNEVVSFHAFLTNVSDEWEADYEDTEGYGRPGKTYAWKNTNRQISLEFITVATSEEDFNQMWWKINKLVTLVYPQYTRGRVLEFEGQRFVQPFSQLPSSTPLIRLRLGDLLKSNFSKFALARLFGVASGQDGFHLQNLPPRTPQSDIAASRRAQETVRTRMLSGVWYQGETATLAPNVQSVSTQRRGRAPQRTTTRARDGAYIYPKVSDSELIGSVTAAAESAALSQLGGGAGALTSALNARGATRTDARLAASHAGNVTIKRASPETGPVSLPGLGGSGEAPAAYVVQISGYSGLYLVPTSALSVHEEAVGRTAQGLGGIPGGVVPETPATSVDPPALPSQAAVPGGTDSSQTAIQRFFSSEENPVFKSFDSVRGSGLPGVIKSINFNWQDATWETGMLGARAPKICNISIQFAPVHDINPGIDHNGFNTAPVYPVGTFGELAQVKPQAESESGRKLFQILRRTDR